MFERVAYDRFGKKQGAKSKEDCRMEFGDESREVLEQLRRAQVEYQSAFEYAETDLLRFGEAAARLDQLNREFIELHQRDIEAGK